MSSGNFSAFHEGRPVAIAVDGAVVVDVLQLPALVQPVEVVVVQREAPVVVLEQDVEGGTRHRRPNAEGRSDPLDELGLSRAKVAVEHDHITRMQIRRQRRR